MPGDGPDGISGGRGDASGGRDGVSGRDGGGAGRAVPDAPGGGWTVWRQDDSGNQFVVARRASRGQAEALVRELEASGHRQAYWAAES